MKRVLSLVMLVGLLAGTATVGADVTVTIKKKEPGFFERLGDMERQAIRDEWLRELEKSGGDWGGLGSRKAWDEKQAADRKAIVEKGMQEYRAKVAAQQAAEQAAEAALVARQPETRGRGWGSWIVCALSGLTVLAALLATVNLVRSGNMWGKRLGKTKGRWEFREGGVREWVMKVDVEVWSENAFVLGTLTNEPAQSSYGPAVLVVEGDAYGESDLLTIGDRPALAGACQLVPAKPATQEETEWLRSPAASLWRVRSERPEATET